MQQEIAPDLAAYKQALLLHLSKFEAGLHKTNVRQTLGSMLLADIEAELARVREDLRRPFTVAVIGRFKYGKSTLVNALLKREVSPMDILPETYAISEISYDGDEEALVYLADDTIEKYSLRDLYKERMLERLGRKLVPAPKIDRVQLREEIKERFNLNEIRSICFELDEIDFEDLPHGKTSVIEELIATCKRRDRLPQLLDICQAANAAFNLKNVYRPVKGYTESELLQLAHHIKKIEVKARVEILKGMRLIDTPGIGDHQELDEHVQASLPQADVVIFVMLARALLSQEEGNFLRRAIDKYDSAKFIFVVNQMDTLRPEEAERVKAFAIERVQAVLPTATICFLSAKEEFEFVRQSQTAGQPLQFHSAFQKFRDQLRRSTHLNRDVMQLERAVSSIDQLLDIFETQIEQFRQACRTDSAGLSLKAEQLQQPDSPLQQRIKQQRTTIKQLIDHLSEQAYSWMDEFIDRLASQTIPDLTEVRLVDIQQEFHLFLSDVVSQAMNACFDRQRPSLLEALHNAQETIRQEYESVMNHADLLATNNDGELDTAVPVDWEKLEVYDQLMEQCLASVFSFTHELMHRVSQLMNASKNQPDWQAMATYKRQLYDSTPQLREAVAAEIRVLYKNLLQDIDSRLNTFSQKYQDNLLSTIHQAETLQKNLQAEYAASDQAVEDVKLPIQMLRRQVQAVKLQFWSMETAA